MSPDVGGTAHALEATGRHADKLAGGSAFRHGPGVDPRLFFTPAFALILPACASNPPPEAPRPFVVPVAEAEPSAQAPKRAVPQGQIRREDVLAVLSEGPPSFLARVDVEPVRDRGGNFLGWKVLSMRDAEWAEGELKVGDVVTRVNGKRIEDPFQFFDVFQSLAFAPELRLSVEHAGTPRELRYPINDDPSAAPIPRAEPTPADDGPKRAKQTERRKK